MIVHSLGNRTEDDADFGELRLADFGTVGTANRGALERRSAGIGATVQSPSRTCLVSDRKSGVSPASKRFWRSAAMRLWSKADTATMPR